MSENFAFFDYLPIEIVEYVLSYLTPAERRVASNLCTKFLKASYHFPDWKLNITSAYLDKDTAPVAVFEHSQRDFNEVIFKNVMFGEGYQEFIKSVCRKVKILKVQDAFQVMSGECLTEIILACPHIEKLTVEGFIELPRTREVELKERLKQIKDLKMSGGIHFVDDSVNGVIEFFTACSRVESLDVLQLVNYITPPLLDDMLLRHPTPLKCLRANGDFFYYLDQRLRSGRVDYVETGKLEALTGTEFSIGCPFVRSLLNVLEHTKGLKELDLTVANRIRLLKLLRSGLKLKHLTVRQVVVERSLEIEPTVLEAQPELESLELEYNYDDDYNPENDQQLPAPAISAAYPGLKKLRLFAYLSDRLWLACKFPNLVSLELEQCRIEDEQLRDLLAEVPMLEKLSLTGLKVSCSFTGLSHSCLILNFFSAGNQHTHFCPLEAPN